MSNLLLSQHLLSSVLSQGQFPEFPQAGSPLRARPYTHKRPLPLVAPDPSMRRGPLRLALLRPLSWLALLATLPLAIPADASQVISWVSLDGVANAKDLIRTHGDQFATGLTRLGLQFWWPTPEGGVRYDSRTPIEPADSDVKYFRDWAQSKGIQVLLTVYNENGTWDWDLIRKAINVQSGKALANALFAEVDRLNLDGVDVDLEGIGKLDTDRPAFNAFIRELSTLLKTRKKILTVDSFHSPCANAPNMSWWKDWVGQVDNIHSIGYQDLYEGATDIPFCGIMGIFRYSSQTTYAKQQGLPDGMLVLGVPAYRERWGSGGLGTTIIDHLKEVEQVGAGIAIWNINWMATYRGWLRPEVWKQIARLKSKRLPPRSESPSP